MKKIAKIQINTVGALHVLDMDGEVITAVGARPRALLAVIALSPRKIAARRWLENLFWCDREQEQASGSLRQALVAIRKALGEHADVLVADRLEVSLDPHRVEVDVESQSDDIFERLRAGTVLLEGLDISSNPFEDWLRQTRAYWAEKAASKPLAPNAQQMLPGAADQPEIQLPIGNANVVLTKPVLFTEARSSDFKLEPFFADAIGAQIARTATEHVNVSVISLDGEPIRAITAPGGRCIIRVTQNGDKMMVLAKLAKMPSGEQIWSRQISFDAGDEFAAIDAAASLSLEATEAFAHCVDQASDASLANAYSMSALQHVFSFDPDRLRRADSLLCKAQEMDQHAPRPALRALAKAFLAVECSVGDIAELYDQAKVLVNQSLQNDQNNALALAFIADVQDLVFNDSLAALSFAERSLNIDPGVGYAHASMGGLELKRGRNAEAFQSAGRAQQQLRNTSLQVFSNMRFCLAAMNVGDFEAAQNAAEQAALLAPNSRPPLRHLYVLRLNSGDIEGAKQALKALRSLEPDFSLSRIRGDSEYPADTIRRVGLDKLTDVEI